MSGQDKNMNQIDQLIASSLPDVPSITRIVSHNAADGIKTSSAVKTPESKKQVQSEHAVPSASISPFLNSLVPRPYLMIGPTLMGSGYAPLAYRAETGLNVESVSG
jgi:hypothetical protein